MTHILSKCIYLKRDPDLARERAFEKRCDIHPGELDRRSGERPPVAGGHAHPGGEQPQLAGHDAH